MFRRQFKVGDQVVYRRTKHSTRPGPRAQDIRPAPSGDVYRYGVDKFWLVVEDREDGTLVLQTRRGKKRTVAADDPKLRPAGWWTRYRYADKFPEQDAVSAEA